MIYLIYSILCICVIWFSIKCAKYVDLIDKKTKISGAFIGGVILAAVTSLPELFTSLSAVLMFNNPEMVVGNVLGSNIFNLAILGLLGIIFIKSFITSKISKSHFKVILFTILIYIILAITFFVINISILNISIASILILIIYAISVKYMSSDDSEQNDTDSNNITLKSIIIRFIIFSIALVITSILITQTTDIIAEKLNLNSGLAGALFLGIATSLPELSSSIALVKRGNFNASVANITGSNIFNFLIISIADFIYRQGSVFISSKSTNSLVIFGSIASLLTIGILIAKYKNKNNKALYIILSSLILICYISFLIFSM